MADLGRNNQVLPEYVPWSYITMEDDDTKANFKSSVTVRPREARFHSRCPQNIKVTDYCSWVAERASGGGHSVYTEEDWSRVRSTHGRPCPNMLLTPSNRTRNRLEESKSYSRRPCVQVKMAACYGAGGTLASINAIS